MEISFIVKLPDNYVCVNNFHHFTEYEKIFYQLNVGDRITSMRLRDYFKGCGLDPTGKEIDIATKAIFVGKKAGP